MQTLTAMLTQHHRTTKGEEFKLTLHKKRLSTEHTYWLYWVQVEHETWKQMGFQILATKQAFPSEDLADLLGKTNGLDAVKGLLEHVTAEGHPLLLPIPEPEGWCVY